MDDLAPDEEATSGADYRSLTQQLKAVGDQAPATPLFGSSPEPGSGRLLCDNSALASSTKTMCIHDRVRRKVQLCSAYYLEACMSGSR